VKNGEAVKPILELLNEMAQKQSVVELYNKKQKNPLPISFNIYRFITVLCSIVIVILSINTIFLNYSIDGMKYKLNNMENFINGINVGKE